MPTLLTASLRAARFAGSRAARLALAATVLLAPLAAPQPAAATPATYTVTTTVDADDAGACGSHSTTGSGPDGLLSLREAVCLARNSGDGVVTVPAGVYTLTGAAIPVDGAGGPARVTIVGAGRDATIVDGNRADRVFHLDSAVTFALDALTVRNGEGKDGLGGGGLWAGAAAGGSVTLTRCRFTGNANDTSPTRNTAPGGAVHVAGAALTVDGCRFDANAAHSSAGGAIWFHSRRPGEDLTVRDTVFDTNTTVNTSAAGPGATPSGGGAIGADSTVSTTTFERNRFAHNTTRGTAPGEDVYGGAVFLVNGTATFTGNTFTGNSTAGAGGAGGDGGAISTPGGVTAAGNRFVGNPGVAGSSVHARSGVLLARDNWWGCNGGPGQPGCDTVGGSGGASVSADRWLTLTATATPSTVDPGIPSTITAGFRADSTGPTVAVDFPGTPVAWDATGGVLSDAEATVDGVATATFTGASGGGPATVTAGVDNATTAAAVTVNRPPAPPIVRSARPGDHAIIVTWEAPASTAGITGYRATAQPGGATCAAAGSAAATCEIGGLTNGTPYTVTVVATSSAGDSTGSTATATPGVAPGPPTGVTAAAGTASMTVTWTPPASAGSGVASYLVTASPGPATCETTATRCVLGAVGGVAYTMTVVARGRFGGDSPPGQPSTPVTPTVPGPPPAPPSPAPALGINRAGGNRVEPGDTLTVDGSGFAPHSSAIVTVYSTPTVLTTVTTDAAGAFAATVRMPADLAPGAHTLVAVGVDPAGDLRALAAPVRVPEPTPLAVTGLAIWLLVAVGLGLVVFGAALRARADARRPPPLR